MTNEVYVEKQGSIATLVLNRPKKKNALSREMFLAIQEELSQLAEDKSVRVLIVRGVDETAFCSGADISEFLDIRFAKQNAKEYNDIALEAINTLYKFPIPTIALIQTLAIGGGLELANSCDFRFATTNSKFGITASNIGIIYNLESTKRLINVVGVPKAKEILYTAKLYNSEEAKEMGLLTDIFSNEEIEEKVQQFAEKLLTKSTVANAGIKQVIQEIVDGKNEESEAISEIILDSFSSKDYTEGITAFLEKENLSSIEWGIIMATVNQEDLLLKSINEDKPFPISFEDLEEAVREKMHPGAYGYIRSGAGGEESLRNNRNAFKKYAIVPRFLKDVSNVDTSIELFGKKHPTPLLFAPVGMNKMAHEEGELAVVRAAEKLSIPYIQSTVTSYSIEEVAATAPNHTKWFQLYWSTNEEIAFSMVERAEKAGFEAIVLTIDTVMLGWREEDVRNQYSPLKLGYSRGNYVSDPVFNATLRDDSFDAVIEGILANIFHPTLNWENIKELKRRTKLPILLKGILHPEDAKLAIENGVDGLVVSNHGGRQLDSVIGSLDALPTIVKAVDGRIPVLFDGGVYRGISALKAIALGADAVLVGRPYIYGLAYDGQNGVEKVMSNIYNELNVSMGLAGVTSIKELRNITIVRTDGEK